MADQFQKAIGLTQKGKLREAIEVCDQILAVDPNHLDAMQMRAIHLSRLGDPNLGLETLNYAVEQNSNNFSLLMNYAELARLAHKFQLAEKTFDQLLENGHSSHLLYYNLGKLKNDQNQPQEAIIAFEKSIKLNPAFAKAHMANANTYRRLSSFKNAFDVLDQARQLFPQSAEILKEFAVLLNDLGKPKDAFEAYRRAIQISPKDPELLNNFGGLLLENRQYVEAIRLLQKCVQVDPESKSAYINLALTYQKIGDEKRAIESYEKIKNRLSDQDLIKLHFETLCPAIAESNQQIDEYRDRVQKAIKNFDQTCSLEIDPYTMETAYAMPSFHMTYQGRNDKEIKSQWAEFYTKRIKPIPLGKRNDKPKIGFLVTHAHEGVFLKDVGGILRNLSGEHFDIVVLANGIDQTSVIKSFVGREDISYVSFPKSLQNAVSEIAKLNLDFLYYWEVGSDILNYLLPFFQLARCQILSWGSAFTSGNPRIQYYWSSQYLENPDHQEHYTEEVLLFDNLPTYYYASHFNSQSKKRSDFGLSDNCRIYLCAQNLIKTHPDFDQMICDILIKDPKAQIVFLAPKHEMVKAQLVSRFENTLKEYISRIVFLDRLAHEDYLQLLRVVDVCLDPPYYSGANTTYEALQAGTPVVSLPGKLQRGKYTEAIYKILGLDRFIPKTQNEYVELACRIANDESLKKEIISAHNEHRNLLYQNSGIVTEIERFLIAEHEKMI